MMVEDLREQLDSFGQSHLLAHWSNLSEAQRHALRQQIASLDLAELTKVIRQPEQPASGASMPDPERLAPPPAVRVGQDHPQCTRDQAHQSGESALRAGRVGIILVAGGQGTRLGFASPKGMFPIGPVSHRTLFELLAHRLLAIRKKFGAAIPFYIMTSPATDAETRHYFEGHAWLGLPREDCAIFCQGTMPVVDDVHGRILLSSPSEIALSPDGHGGAVQAMQRHGVLEDAQKRGIETFFYCQVDNPLVALGDPILIGYHRNLCSEMTTQVVAKRFAKEKVGNVVARDGRVHIIEYSDLPDRIAEQTDAHGGLRYWAGNIAVHCIQRSFLERVLEREGGLPFHRAHKAVPHVDPSGTLVRPSKPNAIKFERFIFDLLPMAQDALVVEGLADECFAPVKNAEGASHDTPALARQALSRLHRRWLLDAGAMVAEDILVEIHPAWALDSREVRQRIAGQPVIDSDTYFLC
jgi:UDP-N-acetylglucosamine/UDP-N-acetylgalactosamine diphosphorylase